MSSDLPFSSPSVRDDPLAFLLFGKGGTLARVVARFDIVPLALVGLVSIIALLSIAVVLPLLGLEPLLQPSALGFLGSAALGGGGVLLSELPGPYLGCQTKAAHRSAG